MRAVEDKKVSLEEFKAAHKSGMEKFKEQRKKSRFEHVDMVISATNESLSLKNQEFFFLQRLDKNKDKILQVDELKKHFACSLLKTDRLKPFDANNDGKYDREGVFGKRLQN